MKPHAVLCLLLFITSIPIAGHGDELMDRIRQARMKRELASQSHASAVNALPQMLPAPLNRTWHYHGNLYKGTLFKLSADRQKVYVISDWDNYRGSWLNVADLDVDTRVSIGVATELEIAMHAKIKADQEAQEREKEKEIARLAALEEEKRRLREIAAEERNLTVRPEILVLLKRPGKLLPPPPDQGPQEATAYAAPSPQSGFSANPMGHPRCYHRPIRLRDAVSTMLSSPCRAPRSALRLTSRRSLHCAPSG